MKQISTVCGRDCYDTCSLIAEVRDSGIIESIKADPSNPFTQGFTCPRGTNDSRRLSCNRVERPSVGQLSYRENTSWETAMKIIVQKLAQTLETHGPESVLYLDYAGNLGTLSTGFPKRLWNALGATQTDMALCSASGKTGLCLHYGSAYGIKPMELLSKDLIVFWGFNAKAASSHLWSLARKARRKRNARIVVIDPRLSESAKEADLWIQPKPGTDIALAYGVMNCLMTHNQMDKEFIHEYTNGFNHLKTEIDNWPVAAAGRITGVAPEKIEELADLYGRIKKSATMIGIGLQKCDQGADQVRTVSFIPALLGQHRGFFYSNGDSFMVDEALISGVTLTEKPHEVVEQVALGEMVKNGKFKFIFVNCMNPALTIPDQVSFREGLDRPDVFLAVHETHWTRTACLADVVLPAPTFLEKKDVVIPWGHYFIKKSNPVVPPIHDSRTEVEVMGLIAAGLGLDYSWLYEEPWQVLEKAFENAFETGTFQDLMEDRLLILKTKPENLYETPTRKIDFYPPFPDEKGCLPLPVQEPVSIPRGQFILLNSATSKFTGTQFQEVFGDIPSTVFMNPEDARHLNITDDQKIILKNDLGQAVVPVSISETVPERILWIHRQALDLTGFPLNGLMSGIPQRIGRGARYNSTRVFVSLPA